MSNSMKRLILICLALLLPLVLRGQDTDFGARISAGVDYKIVKGLHINLEEELRLEDMFQSVDRLQTTLGLSWKPLSFLKLGAGYIMINPFKDGEMQDMRHRLYADVTASWKVGDFTLSWRERLQYTHRTGTFNVYQNTPDAFALKSRVGVKYRVSKDFKPSLSLEVRTALNDPWGSAGTTTQVTASGKTYYPYTHEGYTHMYINRYRLNLGCEWNITKHHSLEPYVLVDSCSDYEIDTNSDGTRLFSAAYEDSINIIAGIGYVYSF